MQMYSTLLPLLLVNWAKQLQYKGTPNTVPQVKSVEEEKSFINSRTLSITAICVVAKSMFGK